MNYHLEILNEINRAMATAVVAGASTRRKLDIIDCKSVSANLAHVVPTASNLALCGARRYDVVRRRCF